MNETEKEANVRRVDPHIRTAQMLQNVERRQISDNFSASN